MPHEQSPDDIVMAHEPDRTLRKLIGEETKLDEIFTPERIEACQKTIDQGRGAFFDVAQAELAKLEAILGLLAKSDVPFDDISSYAANIRGHAEAFGFSLIGLICKNIVAYCKPGERTAAVRSLLIADLVKLLHVAIKNKVTDETGAVASELMASLRKY